MAELRRKFKKPETDGELQVTKGPIGFWRRTCSVCGFSTVNGVPEDTPAPDHDFGDGEYLDSSQEAQTAEYKTAESHYLESEKVDWEYLEGYHVGITIDGKRLHSSIYRCPSCDSRLKKYSGGHTVPMRWRIRNAIAAVLLSPIASKSGGSE